jgi:hypothetical protein
MFYQTYEQDCCKILYSPWALVSIGRTCAAKFPIGVFLKRSNPCLRVRTLNLNLKQSIRDTAISPFLLLHCFTYVMENVAIC